MTPLLNGAPLRHTRFFFPYVKALNTREFGGECCTEPFQNYERIT